MTERTQGLILRTRPLTETSLIVHWLTPDLGRLATVAKGARRPNSPFRGKLDLFYLCDFSFARSRRSQLHILREVVLRDTHQALRHELARLQQASYCAALIEQTTEAETPLPQLFKLLAGLLDHLSHEAPQTQTLLALELKLLAELGQQPDLSKTSLTPGVRQIIPKLASADWPAIGRLKLSQAQSTELDRFLHRFLTFHLGRIPTGRGAAIACTD